MTGRADWTLELQLEQTQKVAAAEEVKEAITAVVRHMHSGKSSKRRGGQKLTKLLEIARLRASEEAEWDVVRLLQDSIDYATERILKTEFEERYRLFQDGARSKSNADFVSRMIHSILEYTRERGTDYLADHPNASADDLLSYLASHLADARFLDAPEDRPGRYRLVRGRAEMATWLERVLADNRIDVEEPADTIHRIVTSPQALLVLAEDEDGQALLKAAELKKRADSLVELRNAIEAPDTLEGELQRLLEDKPWIFGGRYIGVADRRKLLPDSEFDIPLIRGDGSLHIVEIKRAMRIGGLIKRNRGGWTLMAEVNDAIGQAEGYLVSLDENRDWVHQKFGVDARRASATVLIGHPAVQPHIPEAQINEVLRMFNTQRTRVEVITYKELADSAERSLTF